MEPAETKASPRLRGMFVLAGLVLLEILRRMSEAMAG